MTNKAKEINMDTINIAISYIHDKGYAFGVVPETGEQCFIPPHVLDGSKAQRGDVVAAHVVTNPNEMMRQNTRWCALNLVGGGPEAQPHAPSKPASERMSASDLDAEVLAEIKLSAYLSTSEIAQALGVDTTAAHNAAARLFAANKIVKAEVYARPDQSRASFVLWSKATSGFLDVDDR